MKTESKMMAPTIQGQVARPHQVGDIVKNFGAIVRVEQTLDPERGLLVQIIPVTLKGVRQGGIGQRYFANPAKCEPVDFTHYRLF